MNKWKNQHLAKGTLLLVLALINAMNLYGQPTPEEVRALQDKVLNMNLEMAELETRIESSKSLIQVRDETISLLRRQIKAKDMYIEQLEINLKTAEDLMEKQRLWNEQLEQLRLKDSIRYTMQIAEQAKDIEKLRGLYEQTVKAYQAELVRLEKLIIERTFIITGKLRDPLLGTRPEDPILLDEKNNYRVRARTVERLYLNFESSRPISSLPAFYYSLELLDKGGRRYSIITEAQVQVPPSTKVEQQIDLEGIGNGHQLQSGRYKVILNYEENQNLISTERYFTLD